MTHTTLQPDFFSVYLDANYVANSQFVFETGQQLTGTSDAASLHMLTEGPASGRPFPHLNRQIGRDALDQVEVHS